MISLFFTILVLLIGWGVCREVTWMNKRNMWSEEEEVLTKRVKYLEGVRDMHEAQVEKWEKERAEWEDQTLEMWDLQMDLELCLNVCKYPDW